MQRLLPLSARPSDGVDLHAHYADGWLERGGLRVNFVASADGAQQRTAAQPACRPTATTVCSRRCATSPTWW